MPLVLILRVDRARGWPGSTSNNKRGEIYKSRLNLYFFTRYQPLYGDNKENAVLICMLFTVMSGLSIIYSVVGTSGWVPVLPLVLLKYPPIVWNHWWNNFVIYCIVLFDEEKSVFLTSDQLYLVDEICSAFLLATFCDACPICFASPMRVSTPLHICNLV